MDTDLTLINKYYYTLNSCVGFEVELELRSPCICQLLRDEKRIIVGTSKYDIISTKSYTHYYYSSPTNPSLSYRSKSKYGSLLEHKQEILSNKSTKNPTSVHLSTEKMCMRNQVLVPLIIVDEQKITRYVINKDPLIEIIYRDNFSPTLEIEYIPDQIDIVCKYYNELQSLPLWPPPPYLKPKQVDLLTLARKISSGMFIASAKADGVHALLYTPAITFDFMLVVSDIGSILYKTGDTLENILRCIKHKQISGDLLVLEVEFISEQEICIFDIAMGGTYDYRSVRSAKSIDSKTYLERLNYIPVLIPNNIPNICFKSIVHLRSKEMLSEESFMSLHESFKNNDGFIITNNEVSREKFKLKYTPTVDLLYKNNVFTNNNEIIMTPTNPSNIPLSDLAIYEIDVTSNTILRRRYDKDAPNVDMPTDCPPDSHKLLINSIGVPFARVINNKLKYRLLTHLKTTAPALDLVDIGSGKLGDMHKWINLGYNTVYAIDPMLDTTRLNQCTTLGKTKVMPIPFTIETCEQKLLYIPKNYVLSIFFVPWSDNFLPYIRHSKLTAIILMDSPKPKQSHSYSLDVYDNRIKLRIPNSNTALDVDEDYITIDSIVSRLNRIGGKHFTWSKLSRIRPQVIPPLERELVDMYNGYIIHCI